MFGLCWDYVLPIFRLLEHIFQPNIVYECYAELIHLITYNGLFLSLYLYSRPLFTNVGFIEGFPYISSVLLELSGKDTKYVKQKIVQPCHCAED